MSTPNMNDTITDLDNPLGAALAEGLTPLDLPVDRAERLRRRLLRRTATMPQDHAVMATVRAEEGYWQTLAPGVTMKTLHDDGNSHSFLVRLEAGAVLPSHPHEVDEECLVLEGEMHLGDLHFRAGDHHIARAGSMHGRVTSPRGGLMYVRSAGPASY